MQAKKFNSTNQFAAVTGRYYGTAPKKGNITCATNTPLRVLNATNGGIQAYDTQCLRKVGGNTSTAVQGSCVANVTSPNPNTDNTTWPYEQQSCAEYEFKDSNGTLPLPNAYSDCLSDELANCTTNCTPGETGYSNASLTCLNSVVESSQCTYELISTYFPGNFNGCIQQNNTNWKCAVNRPQEKQGGSGTFVASQNPFFPDNWLLRPAEGPRGPCQGTNYSTWDPICFAVYNCNQLFATNGGMQFQPKYDHYASASTGSCIRRRPSPVPPCEDTEGGCKPEAGTLGCAATLDVGVTQSLRNEDIRVKAAEELPGWDAYLESVGGLRPVKVSSVQEYVPLNNLTSKENVYKPGFEPDFLIVNSAVSYNASSAGRAGLNDIVNVTGIYDGVDKASFCCDQECQETVPGSCVLSSGTGFECTYDPDWRAGGRRAREAGPRGRELVRRLSELGGGRLLG